MLIQYASDLHLEFEMNRQFVMQGGIDPVGKYLVLAGDVANLAEFDRYNDFWDWCSGNFKETVVIPGNHDYYRLWLDEDTISEPINYAIRKNVHCCNNVVFQLEDVDLICSTLWSELNPRYERALCSMLPDFQAIFLEGRQIGSKDYCRMHKTALSFLKTAVEASTSRHIVVATHHLPSNAVVADCFKNSVLNSGFVTELGPWIASSSIDFWIYGHSHISIETEIGKTKILSNQLGYVEMGEGTRYCPNKVIRI